MYRIRGIIHLLTRITVGYKKEEKYLIKKVMETIKARQLALITQEVKAKAKLSLIFTV